MKKFVTIALVCHNAVIVAATKPLQSIENKGKSGTPGGIRTPDQLVRRKLPQPPTALVPQGLQRFLCDIVSSTISPTDRATVFNYPLVCHTFLADTATKIE